MAEADEPAFDIEDFAEGVKKMILEGSLAVGCSSCTTCTGPAEMDTIFE